MPTLVTVARFAPYSPIDVVRPALRGLTEESYVIDKARAHNVLPGPCVGEVRNAWIDDLQPFVTNPCAEEADISWTE